MDVKVLTSQGYLERIIKTIDEKKENLGINFERSGLFREIFGGENYGFVLAGDLQKEIRKGIKAPAYKFDNQMYPHSDGQSIGCKLFLPSAFSTNSKEFPSREEVEEIMDYLEFNKQKGNIENIINSKRGTLFEDKLSIMELQKKGFRTPKSYHFQNFKELKKFVKEKNQEYIIKHRFGQEGIQLERINPNNLAYFENWKIQDFIVQKKLNTTDEKRLIFFDNELIASRIIIDRSSPWEKGKPNKRISKTYTYSPTIEEINDSIKILKYSDTTIGCIDWVETKNNGRYYMEINGFGTGYGKGTHPYNVNKLVAQKLKEKYLK